MNHHKSFFKKIVSKSKNNARQRLKKEFEFENIADRELDVLDVEEVIKRENNLLKDYISQ